MKLNLGCGNNYLEGWVNADISKAVKADVYFDASANFPFDDNTFDEIKAEMIIEHLDDPTSFLKELHRVCKNQAKIFLNCPHYTSPGMWMDFQHKRAFSWHSLDYFAVNKTSKNSFDTHKHEHGIENGLFVVSPRLKFHKVHNLLGVSTLANKLPDIFESYLVGLFPVWDMEYYLEVVK